MRNIEYLINYSFKKTNKTIKKYKNKIKNIKKWIFNYFFFILFRNRNLYKKIKKIYYKKYKYYSYLIIIYYINKYKLIRNNLKLFGIVKIHFHL